MHYVKVRRGISKVPRRQNTCIQIHKMLHLICLSAHRVSLPLAKVCGCIPDVRVNSDIRGGGGYAPSNTGARPMHNNEP